VDNFFEIKFFKKNYKKKSEKTGADTWI